MNLGITEGIRTVYPRVKLQVSKALHYVTKPSEKAADNFKKVEINSEDFAKIKSFLENAEIQLKISPNDINLRQYCSHLRNLLATRYGVSI
ncbi:MAG: hypothetical protein VZR09_01355 [Candidatus Gastranaerophilaceae bacterium]|nr:hypothetical protein [Candidatus Gastranaerophilaceae bacterium]